MEKQTNKLIELNDRYVKLLKEEKNFENQKEIVDILSNISYIIDKMFNENRTLRTKHSSILECLCPGHEWEIDSSMWDGHTSRYCTKCGMYLC